MQEQGNGLTDREEMETSLIRALIASYFSIVRQTIQDLVPKAIMRASPPRSRDLTLTTNPQTSSSTSRANRCRTGSWRRCTRRACSRTCSTRTRG